jgi:Icc-related predicted phosphoesterase
MNGKILKCVVISDTHNQHSKLTLPSCDVLIHAGDATGRGWIDEYEDYAYWFGKQNATYKLHIAGNHCIGLEQNPFKKTIESILINNGIQYLNESEIIIKGIKFFGSPITPTFGDWAFLKNRGKDIRENWKKIPKDTNVLITHGPPLGILDSIYNSIWDYQSEQIVQDVSVLNNLQKQAHVGCEELRKIVEELPNLKVHLFGHIHESQGHVSFLNKEFINASSVDQHYKMRDRTYYEFHIHYYEQSGKIIIDFIDVL